MSKTSKFVRLGAAVGCAVAAWASAAAGTGGIAPYYFYPLSASCATGSYLLVRDCFEGTDKKES